MKFPNGFWADERGSAVKSISLVAFSVAMCSIGAVKVIDRMGQENDWLFRAGGENAEKFRRATANLPRANDASTMTTQQVTIDYTPTGSIPANLSQPVILDPCTGIRK